MNSITLTGRLTRDPEMRTTRSAAAVTDFRGGAPVRNPRPSRPSWAAWA